MDDDCRQLGIDPPQIRKPRTPKTRKPNVGKIQPTKSSPDFDTLRVEVNKTKLGYELASDGNGLALRRLKQPITGVAKLTSPSITGVATPYWRATDTQAPGP